MIDSIKRREFLKIAAMVPVTVAAGTLSRVDTASAASVETPVSYQVNGRSFEGMIVYDDSVKDEASDHLHAARLVWRSRGQYRAKRVPWPARSMWC